MGSIEKLKTKSMSHPFEVKRIQKESEEKIKQQEKQIESLGREIGVLHLDLQHRDKEILRYSIDKAKLEDSNETLASFVSQLKEEIDVLKVSLLFLRCYILTLLY